VKRGSLLPIPSPSARVHRPHLFRPSAAAGSQSTTRCSPHITTQSRRGRDKYWRSRAARRCACVTLSRYKQHHKQQQQQQQLQPSTLIKRNEVIRYQPITHAHFAFSANKEHHPLLFISDPGQPTKRQRRPELLIWHASKADYSMMHLQRTLARSAT